MRIDLARIGHWVPKGARVLDLACGDGSLLKELQEQHGCRGYGLEIDPDNITQCLVNGVNVIEQDLDPGLPNFADQSFDTVIMTQALQVLRYPHHILSEMLRVGRECIITFPNFGHWKARAHLGLHGRMPVNEFMPYQWYDTPNIHFCTVADFEALCREMAIQVLHRDMVSAGLPDRWLRHAQPNLFAETALYHLSH